MPRSLLRWSSGACLTAALACASPAGVEGDPRLVSLAELAPDIALDLRYAGPHNFVGEPIDGYEAARCLLTQPAAHALIRARGRLHERGVGLVLYDCYRPQRAVDQFVRWTERPPDARVRAAHHPRVPKSELLARGYIAPRSSHSRGSTVDAGLVGPGGRPLDMGTPFDFFDPRSHTNAADLSPSQRSNRELLRTALEAEGFRNLPEEWWHYTLRDEPYPDRVFDVPVR